MFKSDVYSLGLTFLYMASLDNIADLSLIQGLQSKIDARINSISQYGDTVKYILRCMLNESEGEVMDF